MIRRAAVTTCAARTGNQLRLTVSMVDRLTRLTLLTEQHKLTDQQLTFVLFSPGSAEADIG